MTDRFVVVPAAYVLLLRSNGAEREVLLQLREGTGYMDGYWATVAGHVEDGESVFDAAVREAAEEIGVVIDVEALTPLCGMHRTGNGGAIDQRVDWFFSVEHWSGEPAIMESAKCAQLGWFPLSALPDPVVPHELEVITAVRKGSVPPILAHGFGT